MYHGGASVYVACRRNGHTGRRVPDPEIGIEINRRAYNELLSGLSNNGGDVAAG